MQLKRRLLPNSELLSAALFSVMAIAAVQPVHAQTPPPVTQKSVTPATTPGGAPAANVSGAAGAIPDTKWSADQIAEAFKRTDANSDGNISKQEAAAWAGLARRFDQVDANHDGNISNAEFTDALK